MGKPANIPPPPDDELSAPFWMVTYADMVTLLLTFFVLIVSMSEVEIQKFKEAMSYFQGRSSVLMHDAATPAMSQQLMSQGSGEAEEDGRDKAEKYEKVLHYLELEGLNDKVQAYLTEKGLHLVITDSVMFNSGEAYLIEPSRSILRYVAGIVDDDLEALVVEGHTDDRPIRTVRFPSNWELSSARAASVVRFLLGEKSNADPSRYVALGYGEHHPVDTNTTRVGRARNRRVEIFFSWEPWQSKTNSELQPLKPVALLNP